MAAHFESFNELSGKMAQFSSARAQDKSIGRVKLRDHDLDLDRMRQEADSHSYLANSAWCVCFHLYSGARNVCFYVLDTDHQKDEEYDASSLHLGMCVGIGPFESLHDVKDRLAVKKRPLGPNEPDRSDTFAFGSNTAVHIVSDRSVKASVDGQLPEQVDVLLRVGLGPATPGEDIGISSWYLIYRHSFISDHEAKRLATTVDHVAHTLLWKPTCKIAELGVSPQDWDTLSKWNKVEQDMERRNQLVHHAFTATAKAHPEEQALVSWDGQMNYEELDEASSATAKHLMDSDGFSNKGNKFVALCFAKSRWAIIAMLAVLKAGCVCVFLDPSYPDHRLRQILKATGTRIVLTSTGNESLIARLLSLDLGDECPVKLHKVPCVMAGSPSDRVSVEIGANEPRLRRDSGVDLVSLTSPMDPAFAVFTSGSTGTPKAIILTHMGICTSISRISKAFCVDVSSRILQFASYAFDASLSDILTGLLNGAKVCIPSDDERRDDLQAYMLREEINLAWLTPTVARMLDPAFSSIHLRQLVLIGEAITQPDMLRWTRAGVSVYNGYGPAEATFVATLTRCKDDIPSRNIGRGLNYRTWIVNMPEAHDEYDQRLTDHRHLLPIGARGELFLEGPSLAEGYLHDKAKTEASFQENPTWLPGIGTTGRNFRRVYSTKDMVRYCPDGSLEYLGRVSHDTQVKLGGQRVELAEIEIQLSQMSRNPEFVVVLPKFGPLSGRLAAIFASGQEVGCNHSAAVELTPFQSNNFDLASNASAYLRDRLPPYMVPSIWVAVDQLPVTASGKRNRAALLQKLELLTQRQATDLCHHVTNCDSQEKNQHVASQQLKHPGAVGTGRSEEPDTTDLLRLACSQVLQIDLERVPTEGYSFIRLGGDSIAAMRVSTRLRQTAGLEVRVKDLMACSSLYEVATKIQCTAHKQPGRNIRTENVANNQEDRSNSNSSQLISQSLLAQITPQVHCFDNIEEVYPCTSMQTSLLLSQSKIPEQAVYQLSMAWRVSCPKIADGLVDPDYLEAAWHQTVQRHRALRTVIVEESSLFYQVVLLQYRSPCAHLWLEDEAEAVQTVLSHRQVNETAIVSTNKKCTRPAYRVVIYSVHKTRKLYFRLDINHVLIDGLSALNVLRDVSTAYQALVMIPKSLPFPTRLSSSAMKDFVSYDTDPVRREESLTYWREYLSGVESCIFPRLVDGCWPGEDEDELCRAESVSLTIPMEDISFSGLWILLSENEATLASLFLLVWSIVLHMYLGGGDNEAVFGYLTSGRDAPVDTIDDAVGCFISMLICRAGLGGQPNHELSLLDGLRLIQRASVESALYQAVSLADIHNALSSLDGGRLFNTSVTFMPPLDDEAQEGSALVYQQVLNKDPTEFDISLAVEASRTSLRTSLIYHPSYMSHSHAERVAETVHHVLDAFISDPNQAVGLVCGPSRKDLDTIWQWNERCLSSAEESVQHILDKSMEVHAHREAIFSWDGTLTYAELDRLSSVLARNLREVHDVGPEVTVPLFFEKSCWSVVAQVAVLRCGGCFVMLQPSWPEDRLSEILSDVGARVLLHSWGTKPNITRLLLGRNKGKDIGLLVPIQVSRELVGYISEAEDNILDQDEGCRARYLPTKSRPDDPAYLIYTSGSTGRPKGIVMTHRAVCTGAREHAKLLNVGDWSRVLSLTAISFDMAIENVIITLQEGGCLCIPCEEDRLSVRGVTAFASKSRSNWLSCTPSFLGLFSEGPVCMPTVEVVVVAGEPVPQRLVDLWASSSPAQSGSQGQQHVMFVNAYGPSECAMGYCVAATDITAGKNSGNEIGKGFRATTWIANEHNVDELRPIGAVGELLLEGPCLARGYLNQPELTRQVFIDRNPRWSHSQMRQCGRLYRTGDLVRYNNDGSLLFVGRKDEQIKINGIRTELGDIESRLSGAIEPQLRDISRIVVDVWKSDGGKSESADLLVAFIYVSDGDQIPSTKDRGKDTIIGNPGSLSFQAIVGSILRHDNFHTMPFPTQLPRHMMPKAFIPILSLPMTSSGKVDRRVLQRSVRGMLRNELLTLYNASAVGRWNTNDKHQLQPITHNEIQLIDVWKRVLRVDLISTSDNFFRLGGDSFAAIKLKAHVYRVLHFEFSIADIFSNPVLRDMAAKMEQQKQEVVDNDDLNDLPTAIIKPFSLLSIPGGEHDTNAKLHFLSNIVRECGDKVAPEDIQDVLPCTPMQEALMAASAHSSTGDRSGRGPRHAPPSTSTYSVQVPYRLSEQVDMDAFQAAWEMVMQATSILRSRIVFLSGYGSLLVICRPSSRMVERVRMSSSFSSYLKGLCDCQRFDYGLPLFRVRILEHKGLTSAVRRVNGEVDDQFFGYMVLSAHHAVYDGWSLRLLWYDVLKAYHAVKSGISHSPIVSPHVETLVKHLQLQPKANSEKFWRDVFEEATKFEDANEAVKDPGLEFPQVPTHHQPLACCRKSFTLEPPATKLVFQTREQGITPTAVIQAAWATVLAQYSARRIVSFGCTLSGRDLRIRGIEELRAPTMTVVPLQVVLRDKQSILEFVHHVQGTVTAMIPHEHMGIQNIQQLSAAAKRACAFTSLLTVQPADDDEDDCDNPSEKSRLPTLQVPSHELGITLVEPVKVSGFHPLPLAIQVFRNRSHSTMEAQVYFDPICLDEGLLDNLMDHFSSILSLFWCHVGGGDSSACSTLADVIRTPCKTHTEQMMAWNCADDHHREVLEAVGCNSTRPLLHSMFERQAVQRPAAPAIVSHDGSYTYSELDEAADLLAVEVLKMNSRCMVRQESDVCPVGLCFEHSASALVATLAVLKAGAPFLPLSPSNPPARLAEMIQDADCRLILVSPSQLDLFPSGHLVDLERPGQQGRRVMVVDRTMLDNLRQRDLAKVDLARNLSPDMPKSHLAYILFTSGSTGRPKGVKMQHKACAASIIALSDRFGLDSNTRRLQFTDFSFDNSIEDVFGTLSVGGCVCVPSDSDRVNDIVGFCSAHAVNSLHVTPSVLRLLFSDDGDGLEGGAGQKPSLSDIKSCVVGGEPLMRRDVELIDEWIQRSSGRLRVFYAYGSTETCIDCTATEIVPPRPSLVQATADHRQSVEETTNHRRESNIGRSINPVLWRTWIVGTLSGTLAPIGAVGELFVEGPALAQGYLEGAGFQLGHSRSKTGHNTSFVTNPLWHPAVEAVHDAKNAINICAYRTGDMVRYESDGTILYLGRLDSQIKVNGKRVEFGEVEDQILRVSKQQTWPGVYEVAVGLCDSRHLHAAVLVMSDDVAGSSIASSDTPAQAWEDDEDLNIHFSTSLINAETASMLHQSLMRALPSHMVPQSFIAVDKIPTTASGKRDRRRINEFVQTMCLRSTAHGLNDEVSDECGRAWELYGKEALLQRWWAELLPNIACSKHVGPGAHFFSLGANSITAIKLAGLARRAGYVLRYEDIFTFPVLSDMGVHIEAESPHRGDLHVDENYVAFGLLEPDECDMVLSSATQEYGIARELIQDVYPCTPLQTSLLAATARNPGTYIMAEQVDVSWKSFARVKTAFEYALGMFETFRSCIIPTPGPTSATHSHVQIVLHDLPAWLEITDIKTFVDSTRDGFGYGKPLVRLGFVSPQLQLQLKDDNTRNDVATIVLVAHHAAYDGPSFDLFWTMINNHLSHANELLANKSPNLAYFSTFVKHMESHFDAEAARAWWKADLDGFGYLPCSLVHRDDLSITGKDHQPLASSILHRSAKVPLARATEAVKTTLAITARAAWSLTLSHFTASEDTVYGSGVSVLGAIVGEAPPSLLSQVAGPTIAMVPSRICIDYDETVTVFLQRVHRHAAAEIQFAYLGLQSIASESSSCQKACEFDNIFVIQQQSSLNDAKDCRGGRGQPVQEPGDPSKLSGSHRVGASHAQLVGAETFYPHPIVVTCYPRESEEDSDVPGPRTSSLDIEFIYDSFLVADEHAGAIIDVFVTTLLNLMDDNQANLRLRDVIGLSQTGLASVLSLVRPDLPLPRTKSFLHHLVQRTARSQPIREAIDSCDGRMTYLELEHEASRLAARLGRFLVQPLGDGNGVPTMTQTDNTGRDCIASIAFLLDKGKWPVVTMLAIMKVGCAFVPLDRRYPLQRMQRIIDLTGARVVVSQKSCNEIISHLDCHSLFIEDIPDRLVGDSNESLDTDKYQLSTADPDTSIAYILFTSGSTGTPKGVVMPHSSLCNALVGLAQAGEAPLTQNSRVLQFSNYTFDASMWEIFSTLISGGTVCVPSEHDRLDNLEDFIRRFSVDEAMLTPSVSRVIDPAAVAVCLRTLRLAGEAISRSDCARWVRPELGIRLVGAYGTTESGIVSHYHDLCSRDANHKGIGRSIQCRSWVINSLKQSELAPRGAIGELCIEGRVLARGYMGEESKTGSVFIRNPTWMPEFSEIISSGVIHRAEEGQEGTVVYRTGDLVYYDRDGTLIYVGRKHTDTQAKLRGQRIELVGVETAVQSAVRSCASLNALDIPTAVGLFTAQQGTTTQALGVAFALGKLQERDSLDLREIHRQLSDSLPGYMVPAHFFILDQLPLNGSGKLDRTALRALMASTLGTKRSTSFALPSSEGEMSSVERALLPLSNTEHTIRALLAEILHIQDADRIAASDNFLSLGGDSIVAMKLVSVARRKGLEIRVADIFSHPTIAGIASLARICRPSQQHVGGKSRDFLQPVETHRAKERDKELSREIAEACGVSEESIEDVYPCTPTQVFLRSHAVRFFFALHQDTNVERLRLAIEVCVAAYPILRSRIVPLDRTTKLFQAVLKHTCQPLDWTLQDDSPSGARGPDETDFPGILGSNLMGLAVQAASGQTENENGRQSDSSSYLVWTLSHALYDGWSLNLLIQSIEQVYRHPSLTPPVNLPFCDFVHFQTRQREAAAKDRFWETYLSGVPPQQPLLFDYDRLLSVQGQDHSPGPSPQRDQTASYHLHKPKLARAGVGFTPAAVVVAAWAMAIGAATLAQELTIAYVVSGRNANLAGIETCVGPTVCRVPLRIRLPLQPEGNNQQIGRLPHSPDVSASRRSFLGPTASHVQQELTRLIPYELSGLDGMRLVSESPHQATTMLPLEILVQPRKAVLKPERIQTEKPGFWHSNQQQVDRGRGQSEKLLHLVKAEPLRSLSGGFMVEVSFLDDEEGGFEMSLFWDQRVADRRRVDEMVESVKAFLA